MITIVDYRAGNLASVRKAFEYLGCETVVTEDPEVVRRVRQIVLPGVGHFAATAQLTRTGLRDAIVDAIRTGASFLGICVGMQWMFSGSTEAPEVPGLGLIEGQVERFPDGAKVPHVGWNTLQTRGDSRILRDVPPQAFVYYTHSYRAPVVTEAVGVTDYGSPFAGVVEKGNCFGVQFHPEKSGAAGLQMLRNFSELR